MQDHAFTARAELVASTPDAGFVAGCSVAPFLGALRTRKVGGSLLGLWRLEKLLEVAVLREDIGERLLHNIVGGCVYESGILIDLSAMVSSSRTEALMWRVWVTSSSGMSVLLHRSWNQAIFLRAIMLCTVCAISRARAEQSAGGNLKAAADFKHRDYVIDRNAFDQPKSGRCNIDGALSVVERIGFIGAARSQRSGQLRGILFVGKLVQTQAQSPSECCAYRDVVAAPLRWTEARDSPLEYQAESLRDSEMASLGYSTATGYAGTYFRFRKPGRAAPGFGRCKRDRRRSRGDQLERLSCRSKSKPATRQSA